MGEAKFTKGAWMVSMIDGRSRALIESEDTGYCIADIIDVTEKDMANANLMAAAPEMYAEIEEEIDFLTEILNKADPGSNVATAISFRIYALEALLAKARGESCEN